MTSYRAQQLLYAAARVSMQERQRFSKTEILKQINEIKYLSSQKRVPKLSLRKQILHLENKLTGIVQIEEELRERKSKETKKITSLRKQVKTLKNKVKASHDKELTKKVSKLHHLLGECLANVETKEDVELTQKIQKELGVKGKKKKVVKKKTIDPELIDRIQDLQLRLDSLKHEIQIHKELETKKPEEMKMIESSIELIQKKLHAYYERYPQLLVHKVDSVEMTPEIPAPQVQFDVQHQMMFPTPEAEPASKKVEELPLPPPPRIVK